jgi:hypothetical protein
MPSTHEIKRNDTRPYWPVTLTFEDGTVPDLTGATVRFIARDDSDASVKIDVGATVTNGPAGECEWRPLASETDIAGLYLCEWEATLADATVQTFPTRGYDRLKIIGDLA